MIQYLFTRRPFLDKNRNTFAYEVLFRSTNGVRPAFSPSLAPGDALTLFLAVNTFEQLAGDKAAMLSLGPDVLKDHVTTLLPKQKSVLEVSDAGTPVDSAFVERCEALRKQGFRFYLTDFNPDAAFSPFCSSLSLSRFQFQGKSVRKYLSNWTSQEASRQNNSIGHRYKRRFRLLLEAWL